MLGSKPLWAEELIQRHPVLMLVPTRSSHPEAGRCHQTVYQRLLESQQFTLLPDWYVAQQLQQSTQSDLETPFQQLPEAEQAVWAELQGSETTPELSAIWVERQSDVVILHSIVQVLDPIAIEEGCSQAAQALVGFQREKVFRNPALSATLSLMVPGAGHLYRGTAEGYVIGGSILSAWLLMAYAGLSNGVSGVSPSQWGGILLFLTLGDVILAYFMAGQSNGSP